MGIKLAAVAAILSALVLTGCGSTHGMSSLVNHMGVTDSQQDQADASDYQLWGIYADLAGQTLSSSRSGRTDLVWRWIKPGRVLQENWYVTGMAEPSNIITLWRGEQPGQLYSATNGLMSLEWYGMVQDDGSVLFTGANPISTSFRAAFNQSGELELQGADIQNGQLVALTELQPTDIYRANNNSQIAKKSPSITSKPAKPAVSKPKPAVQTAQKTMVESSDDERTDAMVRAFVAMHEREVEKENAKAAKARQAAQKTRVESSDDERTDSMVRAFIAMQETEAERAKAKAAKAKQAAQPAKPVISDSLLMKHRKVDADMAKIRLQQAKNELKSAEQYLAELKEYMRQNNPSLNQANMSKSELADLQRAQQDVMQKEQYVKLRQQLVEQAHACVAGDAGACDFVAKNKHRRS